MRSTLLLLKRHMYNMNDPISKMEALGDSNREIGPHLQEQGTTSILHQFTFIARRSQCSEKDDQLGNQWHNRSIYIGLEHSFKIHEDIGRAWKMTYSKTCVWPKTAVFKMCWQIGPHPTMIEGRAQIESFVKLHSFLHFSYLCRVLTENQNATCVLS